MSFGSDIGKFNEKVLTEADKKYRGVVLSIYSAVIEATPVDSGRLRSNWFLSISSPSTETTQDTNGSKSQSSASQTAAALEIGQTAYLSNNMPYARRIEYEGYSKQAYAGMLRVTVEKAKKELKTMGFEVS